MAKTKSGNNHTSRIDPFNALPDAEKERIAAQFDWEFVADEARPLTPAQRRLWQKARRKPGRPKVGQVAKVISLSVEQGLLKRADALAKRRKMSRAELVAAALHAELAREQQSPGPVEPMRRRPNGKPRPTTPPAASTLR